MGLENRAAVAAYVDGREIKERCGYDDPRHGVQDAEAAAAAPDLPSRTGASAWRRKACAASSCARRAARLDWSASPRAVRRRWHDSSRRHGSSASHRARARHRSASRSSMDGASARSTRSAPRPCKAIVDLQFHRQDDPGSLRTDLDGSGADCRPHRALRARSGAGDHGRAVAARARRPRAVRWRQGLRRTRHRAGRRCMRDSDSGGWSKPRLPSPGFGRSRNRLIPPTG